MPITDECFVQYDSRSIRNIGSIKNCLGYCGRLVKSIFFSMLWLLDLADIAEDLFFSFLLCLSRTILSYLVDIYWEVISVNIVASPNVHRADAKSRRRTKKYSSVFSPTLFQYDQIENMKRTHTTTYSCHSQRITRYRKKKQKVVLTLSHKNENWYVFTVYCKSIEPQYYCYRTLEK